MTIEKLPSGNYRITQMVNGKRYRITVDHKPTQKEAFALISQRTQRDTVSSDMPFHRACDLYIASKTNVLSPSSIRGYKGIMRQLSPIFMNTKLSAFSLPVVQTEVNTYAANRSPKSVRNMSGFIMGVLKYYGVNIPSPKLPQKEKKAPYIPTADEVKAIMTAAKGSKYETALFLAGMGLRRSEICAASLEDLSGNELTISKALVQDENEEWKVKTTKTTDSTRTITLPSEIADLIRKQGYVFQGYPSSINMYLHSLQDSLGIERFSLHKLRHFFASYMHNLGFSDKQIQEMGGWKSDNVLRTVYSHAMEMDKAKKAAADVMSKLL
jgi:integrase